MSTSKSTRRDLIIAAIMLLAAGGGYLFFQQSFYVDRMKVRGAEFELNLNGDVTHLFLKGSQFGDQDLRHVATVPGLTSLNLTDSLVTDQGLSYLSECRKLVHLNLTGTQVTDTGMHDVSRLSHLRHLFLTGTAITDEGLQHLTPLLKLEWLDLNECERITPEGIESLSHFPALTTLQIRNVPLTFDELLVLRERLPKVRFGVQVDPLIGWNDSDPLKASLDVETGELRLETREEYLTVVPESSVISEEFLNLIPGKDFVVSFYHDRRFRITEDAILSLRQFPNLKALSLNRSIEPRTLKVIAEFSNLERLSLSLPNQQGSASPDLKITYSDLALLADLKNLRSLSLRLPYVERSAFSALRLLPELRSLTLYQNDLEDEDVVFLQELKNLEGIALRGQKLSDTSLEILKKLPHLLEADLKNTSMTPQEINDFWNKLSERRARIEIERVMPSR